ncbi:hypothetical protein FGO68_gene9060 [Halteria grandinella]|uniref:ABC3 transporter permease C-terminal domain-containing protein n=1 Tax=Halteria grandinella TaxID=5974 RepID=A0A8J8SWL1_HALGN|nr:hypothetical protein FGO68_gene9060 [Halteria grandinella]
MDREDGIVKGFNYIGWTLNEVFITEAKEGQYDEMWVGFGMKNLEFYGVNLYGFDSTHLDHSFTEYYFPDETLSQVQDSQGNEYTGYEDLDVLKLLKALSEGNNSAITYNNDLHSIHSNEQPSPLNTTVHSQLINVLIPEAFRKQLPIEVGDTLDMIVGNHGQQITFRCKVIGSVRRMPGLFDFSGYKPAVWMTPGMIVSQEQYEYIRGEYLKAYPKQRVAYDKRMKSLPQGSTFDIPKKQLQLTLKPNAPNLAVNRLTNKLVSLAGETNVFGFNVRKFKEDLSEHMFILYATSWAISIVLFLMTFFQLTVSLSSTLKEDAQELGVLRAIGLPKSKLTLVALYEQLSTLLSAILIGLLVGLISAGMVGALFMNFAELPFVMIVDNWAIIGMAGMGLGTIIIGTLAGVQGINRKSITSILKGQA